MKTIIVILALLFSFSFLQAQVKTIDFVMLDGTHKQIKLSEVESIDIKDSISTNIIEFYLHNKPIIKFHRYAIENIMISKDSLNDFYLLVNHPRVNFNVFAIAIDTIFCNDIDSIKMQKGYSKIEINISDIILKDTINSIQSNYNKPAEIYTNSFYDTTNVNISWYNKYFGKIPYNLMVDCEKCAEKYFQKDISLCFDSSFSTYNGNNIWDYCTFITSDVQLNTEKKIIDTLTFDYRSFVKESGTGTWSSRRFEHEYVFLRDVPYTIDKEGNISVILLLKDHLKNFQYSKSDDDYSGNSGTSSSSDLYCKFEKILNSSAKIEIKIYR